MALKDRVLAVLEANKGKTVSGTKISNTVGVTRGAVWKAVNSLRSEGYSISAVTNRGYCLEESNDLISEQAIRPYLKTKSLGKKLDVYREIDSTNSFTKEAAHYGAVHGTTVIAEIQTGGKGRLGRKFHSPLGMGVYMSVIIRPKLSIDSSLLVTSCAAVAVAQAIERVAPELECQIKWVNDIYINGRKVCGILTEAAIDVEQGGLEYAVIGIGINVQNSSFPEELANTATSIKMEIHHNVSRNMLAAEVLNCLEEQLEHIDDGEFMKEYVRRSNVIGKKITVTQGDDLFTADCFGIDSKGRLLVRCENGEEKAVSSGTIRFA
ncbi:MAG: biotin--[acetyl-CoA-carboxylase] ligase [Oscillospiraceae bacterium]